MKDININVRIIGLDGGDFAYFFCKNELFNKLSRIKDSNENIEFIQIGDFIYLGDDKLEVLDINLKFDKINANITHEIKNESLISDDLIIELIIKVKFIEKI